MAVDKIVKVDVGKDEYDLLLDYLDMLSISITDANLTKSKIVNNLYENWPFYSEREKKNIIRVLEGIHKQCDCFDYVGLFLDGAGKK